MLLLSTVKHFIYWHIPKTGGTSLHTALKKYIDIDTDYYRKELGEFNRYEQFRYREIQKGSLLRFDHQYGLSRPNELSFFDVPWLDNFQWKPIRAIDHINQDYGSIILHSIKNDTNSRLWNVDAKSFYEFTMVREPLDRMISLYNQGTVDAKLNELFPTFGHFIKAMEFYYQHPGNLPDFYDSQVSWVKHPYTGHINIFKLEERDRWFPELCTTLGLGTVDFPIENVTLNRLASRQNITKEEEALAR